MTAFTSIDTGSCDRLASTVSINTTPWRDHCVSRVHRYCIRLLNPNWVNVPSHVKHTQWFVFLHNSPSLKRITPYTLWCDYLTCFPQKLEKKFKEDWNSGRAGYVKARKDMWSCQRSVLVGRWLKGNEEIWLCSRSVLPIIFKGNQVIKSCFTL